MCTKSPCDDWHVNCTSLNRVANSVICARLHTGRLKVNLAKGRKKDADKSAVAMLRNVRQLGCVFQDAEPPESLSIIRKNPKVLGASRRGQFTCKHPREQRSVAPHQCSPYAMKFEDRSQDETETGAMCSRRPVENGQKYPKATEVWCLPAPSVIKPEERELVVDSGASMHVLSRKDLNSVELGTARVSKSPTTVVTANGEVHTKGEATVYVTELDLFVTVKLLEDTPAALSLGKLCQDHSRQKPQLIKDGRRIKCNTADYVPVVVPGLSTSLQAQLHLHIQHQHCRKQSIQHEQEVRVRVAKYGETRRMNQQEQEKQKKETTTTYGETVD